MDFLFKAFETNTPFYLIMTAIISLLFGILSKFITERFVKKKSEKSEIPTIQIKNNSDNTYFSNNTINSNNTTNINTHYHSPTTNSSDNSGSDIIAYILLFGVGLGMGIVFSHEKNVQTSPLLARCSLRFGHRAHLFLGCHD